MCWVSASSINPFMYSYAILRLGCTNKNTEWDQCHRDKTQSWQNKGRNRSRRTRTSLTESGRFQELIKCEYATSVVNSRINYLPNLDGILFSSFFITTLFTTSYINGNKALTHSTKQLVAIHMRPIALQSYNKVKIASQCTPPPHANIINIGLYINIHHCSSSLHWPSY